MTKQTLEIGGMSCGHCVSAVRQALAKVSGVQVDDVQLGAATVSFDEARTPASSLADAVRNAGYEVRATTQG